jgi:hypothetical protein
MITDGDRDYSDIPDALFFRCLAPKLEASSDQPDCRIQKQKKLLWYLLCMTANEKKDIRYHEWIGYKLKDAGSQNKAIKFLKELYPNMKEDEIELLAKINSKEELKELAEAHGMDKTEIKKTL